MSRRLPIVHTTIVIAIVSALIGCSSATNPTLVSRSGAAGIREVPQSIGGWTSKSPMRYSRLGLAAGVVNRTLYAVGGGDRFFDELNTVESFNPR